MFVNCPKVYFVKGASSLVDFVKDARTNEYAGGKYVTHESDIGLFVL